MGCEKANTTRGYWGIFVKYWILWASLEHGWFPLSRYGNGGIDSLTPVSSTYKWDRTSHLYFGEGVEEGYSLWAHEIQGFKSLFSSSETFGFSTVPS